MEIKDNKFGQPLRHYKAMLAGMEPDSVSNRTGIPFSDGAFRTQLLGREVRGFNAFNIPRVAQLSQRSNQFNLRTVRYTEDEVRRMGEDPSYACFSFTLSDKFGDNGLICVVILEKRNAGTLFIDTWFMSCRVLKRGMEAFTLNTLVEYARDNGFKRLVGEYLPTAKNAMVAEHYPRLGFTPDPEASGRLFTLDVDTFTPLDCFIVSK